MMIFPEIARTSLVASLLKSTICFGKRHLTKVQRMPKKAQLKRE